MNCPFCHRYFDKKQKAIDHMNQYHGSEIEKSGMDAAQNLYYSTHGRITGICACGCGKPTEWSYELGKPRKISPDPKCRERMNARAKTNMMKVYGKTTLLNDMEQQKDMQKHRPTAGQYTFKDGGKVGYLSKLEEKFLKFCDTIMEIPSNGILESPEVFTYYDNKTQRERQYIPDFYLPDYNLLVEIKDGGLHPNTNPAFVENTKYKVAMKDEVMKKQTKYNYIKIVDSNYGPFMELLYQITHVQGPSDDYKKPVKNLVVITESACYDIEEEMNFVSVNENFDELYLVVIYNPETGFINGIGVSENKAYLRLYYQDFIRVQTYETSNQDPEFRNMIIYEYRCIADKDKITNALQTIINTVTCGNTENFNILMTLRDSEISFTARPEGKLITNSIEDGKMDFVNIFINYPRKEEDHND